MTINIGTLAPLIALVAGILILLMPRLLNYIVAIYLIVIGIIGLGSSGSACAPPGGNQNRHSAFHFNAFTCAGSPRAGFLV